MTESIPAVSLRSPHIQESPKSRVIADIAEIEKPGIYRKGRQGRKGLGIYRRGRRDRRGLQEVVSFPVSDVPMSRFPMSRNMFTAKDAKDAKDWEFTAEGAEIAEVCKGVLAKRSKFPDFPIRVIRVHQW